VFQEGKARFIQNGMINPPPIVRLFVLCVLLYAFFVSISLMGASFKFFGKGFAHQLLTTTSNPFTGLFIGILATSLVQSSSTITSMVVGLVAGGALTVTGAIPIVIGSNIGTTVTNILVSLGHISRPSEFRRAFAAATIHDFFNLISVIIIFPLQLTTNFLGKASSFLAVHFAESGGMKLLNPLKLIVSPAVKFITLATRESGVLMLIIAIILLLIALRYIVVNLRTLVIGRVEQFFDKTLFKNSFTAMMLGLGLTVMVQSSSITTSLTVPLAAARILTLRQIFPFALGANVGTTITAILASLVTNNAAAVTVAFAHLLFNVTGIIIIWPMRALPIYMAEKLAAASIKSRSIPIIYVLVAFFLIPIVLIYFTR
jgi:sodium-dependent phosphate cotransporter